MWSYSSVLVVLLFTGITKAGKIYYEGSSCPVSTGNIGACTKLELCPSIYNDLLSGRITIKDKSIFKCASPGSTTIICCPEFEPRKQSFAANQMENKQGAVIYEDEFEALPSRSPLPLTNTQPKPDILVNTRSDIRPAIAACTKYKAPLSVLFGDHIFGGNKSMPGEFPHMVALGYRKNDNDELQWRCAGSLISEEYVLTSAHCVANQNLGLQMMRFGKTTLYNDEDGHSPIDILVQSFHIYPEYRLSSDYHDIALLKLAEKISFSNVVRPACLNAELDDVGPSVNLYATGWGKTENKSIIQNWLLKVALKVMPLANCKERINDFVAKNSRIKKLKNGINDGQVCTWDPDFKKDTCSGDSGGPLQFYEQTYSISTIVGITSFGVNERCASQLPGVYARVAYYLEWIESIVWPN